MKPQIMAYQVSDISCSWLDGLYTIGIVYRIIAQNQFNQSLSISDTRQHWFKGTCAEMQRFFSLNLGLMNMFPSRE